MRSSRPLAPALAFFLAAAPAPAGPAPRPQVRPGTGGAAERPMIPGRAVGRAPRLHPDWSRPPAAVPAVLAEAEFPEHYVHGGGPVVIPVDPSRLAVRLAGGADGDASGVARAAGLAVAGSRRVGFGGWHVLDLEGAAPGPAAVAAGLAALRARPEVAFASPAFASHAVEGGWLAVTSDVLARIQPRFLAHAEAIVAEAAPDLEVVERNFAGLSGAYRLRAAGAADGFGVLRAANRLALDERFAWAEPDLIGTLGVEEIPDDPLFGQCWGLHNTGQFGCCADIDLDAPEAWDVAVGDFSVRVLVIDVGVDQDHEDINQVAGRDFTNGLPNGSGDGDIGDPCDNHGTKAAGVVSAIINNDLGVVGVAPGSRVVSARIGTTPCEGESSYGTSFIANAINWGFTQGCLITSASIAVKESSAIDDAYDDTWFNGMMHFASAGNFSSPAVSYPASLGAVHAVAAIDPDGTLTNQSNWGSGLDFAAPGAQIWTTDNMGAAGDSPGNYTCCFGGTSAACPFAAGAAAVIWSALPEYASAAIEFWMQAGATDLGAAGYDTTYGYGIPNPRASLNGPGPFNNFCANAWPILSPVFEPSPFDTATATAFTGEPQEWCEDGAAGASNSVWFAFIAPCDAVIDVNTNGSSYDTVLSVWVGSCTFALPVACDDDSGTGADSQLLDVGVSGGYLYMIKVSDYNAAPDGGMLDFNFAFQQPNDECLDAIAVGVGSTQFCTLGATESAWQPACGTLYRDVWFRHTATQDGELTVSACGSGGFDTQLAVYVENNGSFCPAPLGAQLQACNDDAPGGCNAAASSVTIDVEEGLIYTIRVGGHDGPAGDGSITLAYAECEGDTDGDGIVAVTDLLALLAAWGPNAGHPADFDGDGVVDINDLLALLSAWGKC